MDYESIFAPWRLDWVQRDRKTEADCVFCAMAACDEDQKNRVVARGSRTYVVLNKSPYTPGHLLIIPCSHIGEYVGLDEETLTELAKIQQESISILKEVFDPDGFNIGMNIGKAGGASITDHLHIHVIPRWVGDTNFMPTSANTSVIVEALDETYHRLYESFANQHSDGLTQEESAVQITF